MPHTFAAVVGLLICGTVSVAAQDVRVVDLPPANARSAESFGAIINVRELPRGKVLVSDGKNFLVKLLTNTLATERVVLDSSRTAANTFGNFPMPLISYVGDSTLFSGPRGLLVIDPAGNVARVAALPPTHGSRHRQGVVRS